MNVLNTEFDTPYNSAPFSKIKTTHFLPAFKTALAESKKNIAAIVSNPEPPNFKNTVEALEFSSLRLDRISSLFLISMPLKPMMLFKTSHKKFPHY